MKPKRIVSLAVTSDLLHVLFDLLHCSRDIISVLRQAAILDDGSKVVSSDGSARLDFIENQLEHRWSIVVESSSIFGWNNPKILLRPKSQRLGRGFGEIVLQPLGYHLRSNTPLVNHSVGLDVEWVNFQNRD